MVWKLVRCEIMIRSGPSDLWIFQPSIRLNEVYKFMKYEAPFGTTYGHLQWSREGKESVQISSISGFHGSRLVESRCLISRFMKCKFTKGTLCISAWLWPWSYRGRS
jgi:hypothetical protein